MKKSWISSLIVTVASLIMMSGFSILEAQTWTGAKYDPPRQDDKLPIVDQGDNLGGTGALCDADTSTEGCKNWTHRARFNIDMNNFSITAIGSAGTGASALPALEAESLSGHNVPGAEVSAQNGIAIYARNNSATLPALGVFNRGGGSTPGYGLWAQSSGQVAGIVSGRLTLADDGGSLGLLQIGGTTSNRLSVIAGGTPGAAVYYGQSLLCKPDSNKQCGFGNSGYTVMDNLGEFDPHQALVNLNLQTNRIIGIASSDATIPAVASVNTGVDAGTRVTSSGTSARGLATAAYGYTVSDRSGTSGIYAYHSGIGPGLIGGSSSGWAARVYGRLQVTSAVAPAAVQLGSTVSTLSADPLATADKDLYWGNVKLCTAGSLNCGWSAAAGTLDRWALHPLLNYNMYFESYLSSSNQLTNVGVDTSSPQYVLDVNGSGRLVEASIGTISGSTITSLDSYIGQELYVRDTVDVGKAGLVVNGSVTLHANGLTINGESLDECQLKKIIIACRNAGVCTGVNSVTACP